MDPITLLQITHFEQRVARELAAAHNAAVRHRREQAAARPSPLRRLFARPAAAPTAATCATC
jgi:hypothetical protein